MYFSSAGVLRMKVKRKSVYKSVDMKKWGMRWHWHNFIFTFLLLTHPPPPRFWGGWLREKRENVEAEKEKVKGMFMRTDKWGREWGGKKNTFSISVDRQQRHTHTGTVVGLNLLRVEIGPENFFSLSHSFSSSSFLLPPEFSSTFSFLPNRLLSQLSFVAAFREINLERR